MTITKNGEYFAVVTSTVLADGSFRADSFMHLDGNVLRSAVVPGVISIGGMLRVNLGPASYARVLALRDGETAQF